VNSTADILVVGLGAVGSAALYQAAKLGARVIGIDRFHPPHEQGSSHGETRITRQAIGEGREYVPLVLRSNQNLRRRPAAVFLLVAVCLSWLHHIPQGIITVRNRFSPTLLRLRKRIT